MIVNKFFVNTKIYPLEAVLATSYLFIEKAYIILQIKDKNVLEVKLKGKNEADFKGKEKLRGEFYNELLNNALRLKIAKRNKIVRQCIVQKALFSAVSGQGVNLESDTEADYKDDPLGIAIPWEETKK